jgi:DNA-binding NarL/FixJ family response regulator
MVMIMSVEQKRTSPNTMRGKISVLFRTLIVEDNTSFRRILKDILLRRFPEMPVEEAADGIEALQKVAASVPDLIFMDIRLPGENGLELTRKIKKENPAVTVIILTSYDLPEYREAAQRYGADHFLTKGSSTEDEIVALVSSIEGTNHPA